MLSGADTHKDGQATSYTLYILTKVVKYHNKEHLGMLTA
jgi:hypothetical protein